MHGIIMSGICGLTIGSLSIIHRWPLGLTMATAFTVGAICGQVWP